MRNNIEPKKKCKSFSNENNFPDPKETFEFKIKKLKIKLAF